MIEGHGDDAWKYKTAIRADFSSNVLYGALDAGLLNHLQRTLAGVTHYPEAGAQSLQHAAALKFGVPGDRVLVTNGVTEAIYLIAQAFRQRSAVIYTPAFAEYEDACAAQGMKISYRDWEELRNGGAVDGALVFLCNPNNPTGFSVELDWLGDHPDTLFVVDESYIEFTSGAKSVIGLPNVLVLRSLTKSCRIPGLRVGFVIGAPALIGLLRDIKMPWSVNRLAIEAGLYIFSHAQDFIVPVGRLLEETRVWQDGLRAATGWKVWDTDTHYFLIGTAAEWPAATLKSRLIERHGLLVRDAANFRGLGPNIIRVACQTPEHNQLLTQALGECARSR